MQSYANALIPAAVIIAAVIFVYWRNSNFSYRCEKCGNTFNLSMREAVLAPHAMGKKLVKCPQCGKSGWAAAVHK